MLSDLRRAVCEANQALPKERLVTATSGNASGRDPDSGYAVVKPSGVAFEDLTPEMMLVVDMQCKVIEGDMKPSVDALTHLYVYKHMPAVNAIVHTHSNYATSFAALGMPIPAVLTAIADEFGQAIPCAPYCQIGEEQIGEAVVKHIGTCRAVLLQCHGVFTVGENVKSALKAAIMCEDVAKTVHLAMLKGTPLPIPEEEVRRGYKRYQERYGQK